MKVVFLDHDGVICLESEWGSRYKKQKNSESKILKEIEIEKRFDNFNAGAVKVLNQILLETDAEIVVSSDWRFHASLEEMKQYYALQGVIKSPISMTKTVEEIDRKLWNTAFRFKADLEAERVFEIESWLKDNTVENWVAIDDLDLSALDNFVRTRRSSEGLKQLSIKEKVIKILNNE